MPFDPKTIEQMPVLKGQHKRHVIPQNLLFDAIDAFFEHQGKDMDDQLLEEGCGVIVSLCPHLKLAVPSSRAGRVQTLKKAVNNHLTNLFPEDGGENTTIGFLARQVKVILAGIREQREEGDGELDILEWAVKSAKNVNTYFGFTQRHTAAVREVAIPFVEEATRLDELEERLTSLYHSFQIDLPKDESSPYFNEEVLEIYNALTQIKVTGGGSLLEVLARFMSLQR